MQRFKVMLNGCNFLLSMGDDAPRKYGFYTTRWVKTIDPKEAEVFAIDLVRNCPELKEMALNQKDDPPLIHLESVVPVRIWEFFRKNPGSGYTFYPEESD